VHGAGKDGSQWPAELNGSSIQSSPWRCHSRVIFPGHNGPPSSPIRTTVLSFLDARMRLKYRLPLQSSREYFDGQAATRRAGIRKADGNGAEGNEANGNEADGNGAEGNGAEGNEADGNWAEGNEAGGNGADGNEARIQGSRPPLSAGQPYSLGHACLILSGTGQDGHLILPLRQEL